jgi:hypothetical protein
MNTDSAGTGSKGCKQTQPITEQEAQAALAK